MSYWKNDARAWKKNDLFITERSMKTRIIFIVCILVLISASPVSAILNLNKAEVQPPGEPLEPGVVVNVSAIVEIVPSGAMTFANGHTLQLSTDLDRAYWVIDVEVDGVPAAQIIQHGNYAFVNGYLLSYPTSRDVSVSVQLNGYAPLSADGTSVTVLRVVELNNQGTIVGGSEKTIVRELYSPLPASVPVRSQSTATAEDTTPIKTPAVHLPIHITLAGLFGGMVLAAKRRG
jgi:hypothetical protein